MEVAEKIIVFAGLGFNSILDLKYRRVSLLWAVVLACFGIGKMLVFHDLTIADMLCGLIPGGVCLLLACAAGESVGLGDAWMMLALGSVIGGEAMAGVSFLALGAAAIWAILLLLLFRKSGKYQMPFLPFLLAGYGIVCLFFE